MSAQVQRANDLQSSEVWQVTPVIIKTGGGPEVPPGDNVIASIDTDDKDFKSTLLEDKWQSAISTQTARIHQVEIKDGDDVLPPITVALSGLAVLQISYGEEKLIVQEVAVPNSEFTNVSITSSLFFMVTKRGSRDNEWTTSEGDVPADAPFVVFTQGDRTEKIQCQSTDVKFKVSLDWGEE